MALRLVILGVLLSLFPAGCDRGGTEPDIEVGVSTCHHCDGVIRDLSWAAADRGDGEVRLYDDPGCLLATHRVQGSVARQAAFLDRGGSGRWIAADEVWLARSSAFQSPQGTGWAAYASFAAAQTAVTDAGSGQIVRLGEALRSTDPPPS